MSGIHNLRPERVIRAFEKAGWRRAKARGGSHVKMIKEGNPNILSIPVHKGKPIKQGLMRNQIAKAGLSMEAFLRLYE